MKNFLRFSFVALMAMRLMMFLLVVLIAMRVKMVVARQKFMKLLWLVAHHLSC